MTASDGGPRDTGGSDEVEALLALVGTDDAQGERSIRDEAPARLTWNYTKGERPALAKLYEKAKATQWNATTDIDWSIEVDPESVVAADRVATVAAGLGPHLDLTGTAFEHWGRTEWVRLAVESQNWMLSQFLHGEQGALVCTAKIVETVPWIDAKYFASTQVLDEARHVEVFSRYLDEKLSGHYPLNAHLGMLLDDVVADSRWDMTYLGMQIMVEGLALAAFGLMYQTSSEPLLRQILRLVMADESRHVAFGVLSLQEYYAQLTDSEILDRQEFAFEATVRMRDRLLRQEVWARLGLDPREVLPLLRGSPEHELFQSLLFTRIVPNCRRLGLLDRNAGWLRQRFTELGVIQFEYDSGHEPADDYELVVSSLA